VHTALTVQSSSGARVYMVDAVAAIRTVVVVVAAIHAVVVVVVLRSL
jgi:hypothetical protein